MKKFMVILALIISSTAINTYSQNIDDALRYSYLTPGGTARFMSMGGSFGALGGDFSSLSINPAGIGIYRSSEITFTPSLYYNNLESAYYGTRAEDHQYNFNIHNAGGVFTIPLTSDPNTQGWRNINFGVGINRHNNFNFRRVSEGVNPDNSLLTEWLDQAIYDEGSNPENFDPFTTWLAWDTYLIDSLINEPYLMIDPLAGGLLTRQEANIKGSVREFVLSMGANYNDRLYIGATFGFPNVRYEEVVTHSETDIADTIPHLRSFTYKQNLKTSGTGFNFKLGAIYRISDMIRIGAAIHTPTFFDLEDQWQAEVTSDLEDLFEPGDQYQFTSKSTKGVFDYELNTPLKAIGSLGFVFGTYGLINIDYEYIDYTNARLRSDDYMFTDENSVISNSLQAQHNIRAGGELRLPAMHPVILRAGYAYYSNPYKSHINNTEQSVISAGIGMRDENYFLDFAYMMSIQNEDYFPYGSEYTDPIKNEYTRNGFLVTVGFRF